MEIKKKIIQTNKLLLKKYGIPPRPETPPDPVDMLIATILSQNTNDKNSYKAFQKLKEKYSSWEDVASLSFSRLENDIKIAGLGKQKSKAIKGFLTSILEDKNEISLEHLREKNNKEILQELTALNGVGLKTASCVLLFSLRRNICPVDTHVHRTTNRIGIVKAATPDKTFIQINENLPEGVAHSFHTNLIRLGREICKPAKPSCAICPLLDICEYDKKVLEINPGYKENSFMLLDSVT